MKKYMVLVGLVVLSMLLTATTVSAQAVRVHWSGMETLLEYLDYGVTTYPGNNVHTRGMVELMGVDATDPRVTGLNTVVANTNLDAEGHGPVWGTNRLDVDGIDGYWVGTFEGKIDENGIALTMQGRGCGDLEGLQIRGTMVNMAVEGVIIETPRP
jgi:hypothetical protein